MIISSALPLALTGRVATFSSTHFVHTSSVILSLVQTQYPRAYKC